MEQTLLEVSLHVNLQKVASELEYEPIPMSIISSIPKKHHQAFSVLSRWNNQEITELTTALQKERFCKTTKLLAREIAPEVISIRVEDIKRVLRALEGLARVSGSTKTDPKIVATEICELIKKGEITGLGTSFSRQKFIPVISSIISSQPLLLVAKAGALASDYQNVFRTGLVLTDIRPVFEYGNENPPRCSILTHTLQIHYHIADEPDAHKDIYIALDSKQLKYLKGWLIEAERQEKLLIEAMSGNKMIVLKTEDNE